MWLALSRSLSYYYKACLRLQEMFRTTRHVSDYERCFRVQAILPTTTMAACPVIYRKHKKCQEIIFERTFVARFLANQETVWVWGIGWIQTWANMFTSAIPRPIGKTLNPGPIRKGTFVARFLANQETVWVWGIGWTQTWANMFTSAIPRPMDKTRNANICVNCMASNVE